MTLSQSFQDDVCQKLRLVGLAKGVVLPLVNSITRQVRCEGPENVVKRLKVLKQAAVNHIAGQKIDLPWVAHDSNGKPKGPWRRVWALLESKQYKHRKRALNAMMVYASLVLPKRASPTSTQERKFLSSVAFSPEEVALRESKLDAVISKGGYRHSVSQLKSILKRNGWRSDHSDTNLPDIQVWLAQRYSNDPKVAKRSAGHLSRFLNLPRFYDFHCFPQVKTVLGAVGDDHFELTMPWNGSKQDWRKSLPVDEPIGVIGSSQEPGLKFRAFASPNLVIQCALERLKTSLLKALEGLSWDCTHNQQKGVDAVQTWLQEGKTCFSVDLSDATNNFPLLMQSNLLKFLDVPEEDILLLHLVSRSPYTILWDPSKREVAWNVGQPLGAGPSFMSFALTHGLVALEAVHRANQKGSPTTHADFLILGDDFITCDADLHREYRHILQELSCPVSESKCLVSDLAGEFAGKLITKDHVFHGFKYKDVSDLSFMSVVRTLGAQAINRKLLTKHQYEYCRLVKELPEPYGLGFNPKGRPLADRYEELLALEERKALAKRDTEMVSALSLVTKYRYLAMHERTYRYFDPRPECVETRIQKKRSEDLRESIAIAVTGDEVRVAATRTGGDPRENPVKDQLENARILAERQLLGQKLQLKRAISMVDFASNLRESQARMSNTIESEALGQQDEIGRDMKDEPDCSTGPCGP